MFKISKIQKNKKSDLTIILLTILNSLFLIYYVILAYYNRPHYDDIHFLWKLKEISISNFVSDMYLDRSGRFIGYFINAVIYKIILFFDEYRFFPIIFWFIGIVIFWTFTKTIFTKISRFLLLNVSVLFYNLFIFTNIDFSVFYWLCAMYYYLSMPILLLSLVYINKKTLKISQKILLCFFIIFLGGSLESFTPIVLIMLFINALYYFSEYNFNFIFTLKDIRVKKIICITLIILICYFIVVIAPGNFLRLSLDEFKVPTKLFAFSLGLTEAIINFYYYFIFYVPYYFIMSLLVVNVYLKSTYTFHKTRFNYKQLVLGTFVIYIFYILISVTPSVILWSGFGIQRNYTHVVFTSMLFIIVQSLLFVHFHQKSFKLKYLEVIQNIGIVTLTVIMIINIANDTISAQKYAKSVDKRIEQVLYLNKEGLKNDVEVEPLYIPYTIDIKDFTLNMIKGKHTSKAVLYYISDTDYEPNEYAYHLSKFYNLNFKIKLKKDNHKIND